jgi:C1A family cysteine protease
MFKLNLLPDTPDSRDILYKASSTTLPESVDLRAWLPSVRDQGYLGSCMAHAAITLNLWARKKAGLPTVELSPLFLYWQARKIMNRIPIDSGAMLRDGMKLMAKIGVCPEIYYPYDQETFTNTPTEAADATATKYKIASYKRVADYKELPYVLADGQPVVFGMTLWSSIYDTGSNGIVPMYNPAKDSVIGSHAMIAVGYKYINGKRHYIVRNSWGISYGDKGDYYFPEEWFYLANDMWTAEVVVTTDDFDFREAINVICDTVDPITKSPIFDSPDFWLNLIDKYNKGLLTNEDFLYVQLAFIKFATFLSNNVSGHEEK